MPSPPRGRLGAPGRLRNWLNDPLDPGWRRPRPDRRRLRADARNAACFAVAALVYNLGISALLEIDRSEILPGSLCLVAIFLPTLVRRRFPLTAVLVSSALFIGLSHVSPDVAVQVPFAGAYFTTLYSSVAWSQDRRRLWATIGVVLTAMLLWIVIVYSTVGLEVGSELFTAILVVTIIGNLSYFVGSIGVGRLAWRSALRQATLEEQARRLAAQSEELARRAVVEERLRIARELHDVVAHHVSVMGIQAGAARRVLTRSPEDASAALSSIEDSSRHAITDLQALLGVLRADDDARPGPGTREAGLDDVAELVETYRDTHLRTCTTIEEATTGHLARVPASIGASLFRVVQESLANTVRHSCASSIKVTLRTGTGSEPGSGPAWVEVEVIDDGLAREGTSGSGYGLRGMHERVRLLRGELDIGPRADSPGWRVRVRVPTQTDP